MIYLGSPYSHPNSYIRQVRYSQALHVTATLLSRGETVYSPIVHCHVIASHYQLPTNFAFWNNLCTTMLAKSNRLYVLKSDGWEESIGLKEEIEAAGDWMIPITYLEAEEWLK